MGNLTPTLLLELVGGGYSELWKAEILRLVGFEHLGYLDREAHWRNDYIVMMTDLTAVSDLR